MDFFIPITMSYRAQHNTTTTLVQMYDGWLQAVEAGKIAGVCLLDMSAAFDVVDHSILTDKLALNGFDENALDWVTSYLSGRSQCVQIEGSLSRLQPVHVGVPQGSILGPQLYTLFSNELPVVIHDRTQVGEQEQHGDDDLDEHIWPAYHLVDCKDGVNTNICCYADDTTLTTSDNNPAALTLKLTEQYKVIAEFMINNRLKLNDDKTHLLVMSTGQQRDKAEVKISTPSTLIKPSKTEKLLGCWVQDNLKWTEY